MSGNRILVGLERVGQSWGVGPALGASPAGLARDVPARVAVAAVAYAAATCFAFFAGLFAFFVAGDLAGVSATVFAAAVVAPPAFLRAGVFRAPAFVVAVFLAAFFLAAFLAGAFFAAGFFMALPPPFPFAAMAAASATSAPRSLSYRSSMLLSGRSAFSEAWRSNCWPPMPR